MNLKTAVKRTLVSAVCAASLGVAAAPAANAAQNTVPVAAQNCGGYWTGYWRWNWTGTKWVATWIWVWRTNQCGVVVS